MLNHVHKLQEQDESCMLICCVFIYFSCMRDKMFMLLTRCDMFVYDLMCVAVQLLRCEVGDITQTDVNDAQAADCPIYTFRYCVLLCLYIRAFFLLYVMRVGSFTLFCVCTYIAFMSCVSV